MKRSTLFSFLLIGLMAFAATGCKKKGVGITPIPGSGRGAVAGRGATDPGLAPAYQGIPDEAKWDEITGNLEGSNKLMNNGPQERSILQAETIYFDLDSAVIKSSEQDKLKRVADYLAANPTHDVLIEGHCDERGTEGYNMSLGEKRALAAREYIVTIGGPANRVYTTSFGESRPADPASNESAWAKNRRGEFVVVLPAQ